MSRLDCLVNLRRTGTITAMDVVVTDSGYLSEIGSQLYLAFQQSGILLRPLGNTIYVLPPYCMTQEDFNAVYDVIADAVLQLAELKRPVHATFGYVGFDEASSASKRSNVQFPLVLPQPVNILHGVMAVGIQAAGPCCTDVLALSASRSSQRNLQLTAVQTVLQNFIKPRPPEIRRSGT